jgi:hypothetical protein
MTKLVFESSSMCCADDVSPRGIERVECVYCISNWLTNKGMLDQMYLLIQKGKRGTTQFHVNTKTV